MSERVLIFIEDYDQVSLVKVLKSSEEYNNRHNLVFEFLLKNCYEMLVNYNILNQDYIIRSDDGTKFKLIRPEALDDVMEAIEGFRYEVLE